MENKPLALYYIASGAMNGVADYETFMKVF
jgi:hypothetical protein